MERVPLAWWALQMSIRPLTKTSGRVGRVIGPRGYHAWRVRLHVHADQANRRSFVRTGGGGSSGPGPP